VSRIAVPPTATVAAAGDVLATSFDDDLVLLNLKDGVYYGLEGVGTRIWALIQRPTRVADIRDTIAAEYEVDPEVCETDLRALLGELVKRGLAVVKV
jgi:hypothetical protein